MQMCMSSNMKILKMKQGDHIELLATILIMNLYLYNILISENKINVIDSSMVEKIKY